MSDSSDSTFVLEHPTALPPSLHCDVNDELTNCESQVSEDSSSSMRASMCSKSSDTNDSAPEVWNDTESSLSENECDAEDPNKLTAVKQFHYTVCFFLSFFQLCFHISDKALTYFFLHCSRLVLLHSKKLFSCFCKNVSHNIVLIEKEIEVEVTVYNLRR